MVAKFEYPESKSTGSTPIRFRKISRALGVPPSVDDILMQGETNRKLSLTNLSPTSTPSSRRRKISRAGERVADMVRSFSAQNMQVIWLPLLCFYRQDLAKIPVCFNDSLSHHLIRSLPITSKGISLAIKGRIVVFQCI